MRRHLFAPACVVLIAACTSPPEAPSPLDAATERSLPAGRIVGYTSPDGAHAWRAIPYAEPPVGELRWRAPRKLAAWEGTLEAFAPGASCVQLPMSLTSNARPDSIVGSEDCLTLSVFAPARTPNRVPTGGDRMPVMVWIHGGGNLQGENGTYDWSRFAAKHDTVVVALNYRLGLFGWFRHEALWNEADSASDRSGNFGTLDLIRGLEWVRDNASAFGGDPGNVTIFGESAGGNDVITLLLSPLARGLFQRAIAQSGGLWSTSIAEAENWQDADEPGWPFSSREVLGQLLVEAGIADGRDAARSHADAMSPSDTGQFLRGRSQTQLMDVLISVGDASMDTVPLTIREGVVVPQGEMIDSFARGSYTRVPTILGTNRDESKLFMMAESEHTWNLFGVFPRSRDRARYERDAEYRSAAWKASGADEIAIEMRRNQGPSVWSYRFDWDEEPRRWGVDLPHLVGAAHGVEIPFVMGITSLTSVDAILTSEENKPGREWLSERMGSYWAEFARNGDPGRGTAGDLPRWTPWDDTNETSARFIVFDTEAGGGVRMSSEYVTAERIAARLHSDSRFTAEERCDGLARLEDTFPRYRPESTAVACFEPGFIEIGN